MPDTADLEHTIRMPNLLTMAMGGLSHQAPLAMPQNHLDLTAFSAQDWRGGFRRPDSPVADETLVERLLALVPASPQKRNRWWVDFREATTGGGSYKKET